MEPAVALRQAMGAHHITQTELAGKLGISAAYLSDILHGRRAISTRMALLLEDVVGESAEYWWRLQCDHDLAQARALREEMGL